MTACAERLIHDIEDEITLRGENKSKYPINIGRHEDVWIVNIEVNSTAGTFDVETEHHNIATALTTALTQTRKQYNGTP